VSDAQRTCTHCSSLVPAPRRVCGPCRQRRDSERYSARVVRVDRRKQSAVLGRAGTAVERFMVKVRIDEDGCWRWLGALNGLGYAQFAAGPTKRAHRWSYTHFVGPIPDGMQLDHLCAVRDCVNPEHLEPVTAAENSRRSRARASALAASA
jgi:RNA polymerase subunit RPABC4/transcription elongation factor Spt4